MMTMAAHKGSRKRPKVVASNTGQSSLKLADAMKFFLKGEITSSKAIEYYSVIEQESHAFGLLPKDIKILVDVLDNDSISLQIRKRLVLCLIPKDNIPEEAMIVAVCYITGRKIPLSLKVDIVKWMCAMYSHIDSTKRLSSLYAVLFTLINSDSMQPYICELLFRMTTEEQVLSYRIKALCKMGTQPHIVALIQLYANYRTDLVMMHSTYKSAFRSHGRFRKFLDNVKRAESSQASFSATKRGQFLEKEVTSLPHLLEIIGRLENFGGISRLLNSPMRRILLTSNLSESVIKHLSLYLKILLFAEASWMSTSLKYFTQKLILPLALDITTDVQEGIPDVCMFIGCLMQKWDGQQNLDIVLDLISYWELCPFEYIFESVLLPLYRLFCYSSVDFMCAVLDCVTKLYRYWVLFEIPRYQSREKQVPDAERPLITVFRRETDLLEPKEQVKALACFIDQLCTVSLQVHPSHPPVLLHAILRLYETVLVNEDYTLLQLHLPPPAVVCALAFTTNPFLLSQLCGFVCQCKNAVRILKTKIQQLDLSPSVASRSISSLNAYIQDLGSMLGTGRAFEPQKNSKFFLHDVPRSLEGVDSPHESFLLFRNPALLGLSFGFFNEMKQEMSPEMLIMDSDIRKSFFKYLSVKGFEDIVSFLNASVNTYWKTT